MKHSLETLQMPEACRQIIDRLKENGHRAYAVGGCVRDALLGQQPHDWDITTSALPQQILALFPEYPVIETGLQHGTVTLVINHEPFEITTFRIDGDYSDGRHPDSVRFTASIEEDLARRDFTINAMAYNDEDGLIDPFGGRDDLAQKQIRCVGDPERRFSEDALRLFRAVRFSAVLGFSIHSDTLRALHRLSPTITLVAKERIFSELKKTLTAPQAAEALRTAPELLFSAVPQLACIRDVPQNSRYHIYDVWEHTLHALEASSPDCTVRLALLLHDTGKGVCRTVGADGRDHFYGHAGKSAAIARDALHTLRCDNKTLHDVVKLVELHDLHFPMRPAKFRRLLASVGYELFYKLIDVSKADSLAHAPEFIPERLAALDEALLEARRLEKENYCLSLKQLAVNGRDMAELGLHGQEIGQVLHQLLDEVILGQQINDRDRLLTRAQRIYDRSQTNHETAKE